MVAVMSKSAITPSFRGRTATIEPGVRPIISFAWEPTAKTVSERTSTATTDGSRITIPLPFMKTRVLAVPRSIPMSFENIIYFPLHLLLIDSMSFLFCIWIHYTPKPINSQQIIPAVTNFLKNFHNLHNSGFLFLPGLSERHKTEAAALVFSAPESFKAASAEPPPISFMPAEEIRLSAPPPASIRRACFRRLS